MANEFQTLKAIGESGGGRNPVQETRFQELLKANAQGNPFGIESPTGSFLEPDKSATSTLGAFKQPDINLPQLYEGLIANSGIKDIEAELSAKSRARDEAVAAIKDNPFLSEATMTGRLSKIDEKFNNEARTIQGDIARKKADIETRINLETGQFNIESQQAQTAFNRLSTLLSGGFLDNASGEDIANLTRATGISSSMIQSAIDISKKSKEKPVKTQLIEVDDGTNVSAVLLNADTGEIINKEVIAKSQPKKTGTGPSPGGGLSSSQRRKVVASASKALSTVDLNKDKKISLQEYVDAWQQVISATGVDNETADNILTGQMNALGYSKWHW